MLDQGWRWFGPDDPVTLDHVRQAGASHIVSALHDRKPGEAWTAEAVAARKALIETTPAGRSPLFWTVIESIPVADEIKRRGADAKAAIAAWIESLEAVAAADGPRVVCYNFMPVVDWTRTDLDAPMPTGATALRFDHARFAAFDLFLLRRPGAEADYDDATRARAKAIADALDEGAREHLVRTIAAGLPGTTSDALDLDAFRDRLAAYRGVDSAAMRANLVAFLEVVTPVAERLGRVLTLHPDDPPRSLFGLPRVASTAADYAALFAAVPSPANGMCFCTGSLGVRADNDLPAMVERFAPRIHFAHLRSTRRDADGMSFHEADHLDGDFEMIDVLRPLMAENARRAPGRSIVFRPDHGHRMLGDLTTRANPGYTAIGRLKGLAEVRGAMRAIERLGG
jgi:mannonate dehydratase